MLKLHCKFTTTKGTLRAGVVAKKEVQKYLSKSEIEKFTEEGLIEVIEIPEMTASVDAMSLEEMLDADKQELKVAELKQVCEHYKLEKSGNKDDLVERIATFEVLLDADLDEMDEEDVKKVASYYEVDTALALDEMIDAIEEVSA